MERLKLARCVAWKPNVSDNRWLLLWGHSGNKHPLCKINSQTDRKPHWDKHNCSLLIENQATGYLKLLNYIATLINLKKSYI